MAVIVNNQNQDQEQQSPGVTGVSPVTGGAPASTIAPVTNTAPKQVGSGQFTNLQKYLQANQGSGQKIAGEIANKGTQTADKTGQAIQNAQGTIGGQIQAENQRIGQASGIQSQLQQDPTKIASNQDQLAATQRLLAGTTDADNINTAAQQQYGTIQSQLGDLQNFANASGTEQGRFDLLRQTLGRPTYTQGQQKLDQLLVQSGGQNILSDLQKNLTQQANAQNNAYNQFGQTVTSGLNGLTTQAQAAQAALKGTIGQIDDPTTPQNEAANGGILGSLQQNLQQKQAAYLKQQQDLANLINQQTKYSGGDFNASGGNIFDKNVLDALGISSGQNLYNVDLSKLIDTNVNKEAYPEQSFATADDLARYQALQKIAGTNGMYLTQAGTTPESVISADEKARVQAALSQANQGYQALTSAQSLNPIIGAINDLMTPVAGGSGTGNSRVVQQLRANLAPAYQALQQNPTDPLAVRNFYNALQQFDPQQKYRGGMADPSYNALKDYVGRLNTFDPTRRAFVNE